MIVWYGERGVVNAMVTHLSAQKAGVQFLRCISWAAGKAPDWIERVTEVAFLVEVGLADFGNPDLILVCTVASDDKPRCVFIEAKVVPYAASAIPNTRGMEAPNYNSACNGQLALKYRFAIAIVDWKGQSRPIVEPASIHERYRIVAASGGLSDTKARPRHLEKPQILSEILESHRLVGLPLDHCAFVALTWDRQPFFQAAPDLLPRFLDDHGVDRFGEMAAQVGWLGYRSLSGVPGLLEAVTPTLQLMVGGVEPLNVESDAAAWRELSTQAMSGTSAGLQELTHELENLAVEIFGREAVLHYPGSISIRMARVESKIVPQRREAGEYVLLGVRPEWPLKEWSGLDIHNHKVNGQPFAFVRLPDSPGEAVRIAKAVLSSLAEVQNEDRGHE